MKPGDFISMLIVALFVCGYCTYRCVDDEETSKKSYENYN